MMHTIQQIQYTVKLICRSRGGEVPREGLQLLAHQQPHRQRPAGRPPHYYFIVKIVMNLNLFTILYHNILSFSVT